MRAKKPASNNTTFTTDDLRKVWAELQPQALVERLRVILPDGRWTVRGSRVTGCCPYHSDSTPSFHIYLDRGYAKCYGCNRFVSNPARFWADILQVPLTQALLDLRQSFNLNTIPKNRITQCAEWDRFQQMKEIVVRTAHRTLLTAISNNCENQYAFARPAVDYLLKTRKVPKTAIANMPFLGILPPVNAVVRACEEATRLLNDAAKASAMTAMTDARPSGFVGLDTLAASYLEKVSGLAGWLLFELDTTPDTIGYLKLRRPTSDVKEFIILSDDYSPYPGFMGLRWANYRPLLSNPDFTRGVYLVEGEFDALSVMHAGMEHGGPGFVVISTGGTSNSVDLDVFHDMGFDEVYLWSDAPVKNGDALIKHWLEGISRLRAKIFINYAALNGANDPDSAVLANGFMPIQNLMLDLTNPGNFQTPPDWIFDRASREIEKLKAPDIRVITETAGKWGVFLGNMIDSDRYIDLCQKAHGVSPGSLRREIAGKDDGEEGFIIRASHAYNAEFFTIGQMSAGPSRKLHLWHRARKRRVVVNLSDAQSIDRELSPLIGPRYQFFREKVGIPTFLEQRETKKSSEPHLSSIERHLQFYDRNALLLLAQDAPDMDSSQTYAQGLHIQKDDSWYLVNGASVYRGTYQGSSMQVDMLDGPRDGQIIFDVDNASGSPPWLDVRSPNDFARAKTIDLNSVYDRLCALLNMGWRFKNHDLVVRFLAAHMMSLTISSVFRKQTAIGFHAESSSGKSRLLLGLIGGTDFPRINVVPHAVGLKHFTVAGFRQAAQNSSRPFCLDEFESDNDTVRRMKTVEEVMSMLRTAFTGENNEVFYGTMDGKGVSFRMQFPVLFAAITTLKRTQDRNRIVAIDMDTKDMMTDPETALLLGAGQPALQALRNDMGVALLPHIPRIRELQDVLETKLTVRETLERAKTAARSASALLPALAVMELLGKDAMSFFFDWVKSTSERAEVNSVTDTDVIFDAIIHSPQVPYRHDPSEPPVPHSVGQMLLDPVKRTYLNSLNVGVHLLEDQKLLVVNWQAALQSLLRQHPKFSRETNYSSMRDMAARSKRALNATQVKTLRVLETLRSGSFAHLSPYQVTVYDITDLITNQVNHNPQGRNPIASDTLHVDTDFTAA